MTICIISHSLVKSNDQVIITEHELHKVDVWTCCFYSTYFFSTSVNIIWWIKVFELPDFPYYYRLDISRSLLYPRYFFIFFKIEIYTCPISLSTCFFILYSDLYWTLSSFFHFCNVFGRPQYDFKMHKFLTNSTYISPWLSFHR